MEKTAEPRVLLETPRAGGGVSAYEVVYRTGFRTLRFSAAMEDEYRRASAPVIRHRLGMAGTVGLLATAAWFLLDFFTVRYFQFPLAWILLGGWTASLMVGLMLFNRPGHRKRPVNQWLLLAIDILLGYSLITLQLVMQERHLPGAGYPYVALLVMLSATYVAGMMTWRSAFAGTIILLSYGAVSALLVTHGIFPLSHALFFLLLVIVIGTSASWRLEHADREHFLLNHMLADKAEHDSLTGLLNHAAFMRQGTRAWRQAVREKKTVGLLVADIDHFKRVNDHYGHPAGDVCIYRIAALLADSAKRGLDVAARLGGEEFAVFWYDIPAEQVAAKAEAFRTAVHGLELPHESSETAPHVTVSIGIFSAIPAHAEGFKAAIAQADQALYAAKNSGRDRICVAPGLGRDFCLEVGEQSV